MGFHADTLSSVVLLHSFSESDPDVMLEKCKAELISSLV